MKGFFTQKETESASRPDGKILSCASCGNYRYCETPKMQPIGNFKKQIMIIGTSPERVDDKRGLAYQSLNAEYLEKTLANFGINMFEDCLLTYAHHCYNPDAEGAPTNYEIECCRKTTIQTVRNNKPKLIILLGGSSLFSLIGHRWKRDLDKIDKWGGWCIPDQDFKTWLCPVYATEQVKDLQEVLTVWKADLERALDHLDIPFPFYKEPVIKILEDDLSILNTIKGNAAFDYETTGLKPHTIGHEIVCVSIAISSDLVYVFMLPERIEARKPFINFLLNPDIGKIAQNCKYEDTWTNVILGVDVVNWIWDTMLATHILDNRAGVTGLKFQTYVQFGIIDYESEVESYLKSDEVDNANAFNKIKELLDKPGGKQALLKYCGYDSINEYRLAEMQRSLMGIPS